MENLIADFVQFSRRTSKYFFNLPHFERYLKSFDILFGNLYIQFVVIIVSSISLVLKENYAKRSKILKVLSEGL